MIIQMHIARLQEVIHPPKMKEYDHEENVLHINGIHD